MLKSISRDLLPDIYELALRDGKMGFISGPRQVGKTTLANQILKNYPQGLYCNWDQTEFRRTWVKNPSHLTEFSDQKKSSLLVLDEIHKAKLWKRTLKGIFDTKSEKTDILVTGSARLNIFNKGGDSLMGRYIHFRLNPLSLNETDGRKMPSPTVFMNRLGESGGIQNNLELLVRMSGFPDPFLKGSAQKHLIWQRNRITQIVREDLRDLSRIPELSKVEMLISLMPEKVGSPLSVQSLREDLEIGHDTASRWVNYLNALYYHFEVRPYSKKITRSLKKEPKIYLYDWSEVKDSGPRFENFVAVHLLKFCQHWTDTGVGVYDLFYLRNKEKKEVDFLITENKKPWFTFECKISKGLDTSFISFQKELNCPHIQVIQQPGVYRTFKDFFAPVYEISAHRIF